MAGFVVVREMWIRPSDLLDYEQNGKALWYDPGCDMVYWACQAAKGHHALLMRDLDEIREMVFLNEEDDPTVIRVALCEWDTDDDRMAKIWLDPQIELVVITGIEQHGYPRPRVLGPVYPGGTRESMTFLGYGIRPTRRGWEYSVELEEGGVKIDISSSWLGMVGHLMTWPSP